MAHAWPRRGLCPETRSLQLSETGSLGEEARDRASGDPRVLQHSSGRDLAGPGAGGGRVGMLSPARSRSESRSESWSGWLAFT